MLMVMCIVRRVQHSHFARRRPVHSFLPLPLLFQSVPVPVRFLAFCTCALCGVVSLEGVPGEGVVDGVSKFPLIITEYFNFGRPPSTITTYNSSSMKVKIKMEMDGLMINGNGLK